MADKTTPPSLSALIAAIPERTHIRRSFRPADDYSEGYQQGRARGFNECRQHVLEAVRSVPMEAYLQGDFDAPESAPRPDVSLGELWEWFAAERKYRNEVADYNTALALNRAEIESGELAWPGRNLDPLYQAWNASQKESREAMRRLFDALASNESALRAQSPAEGGGAARIAAERQRQKAVEGWTPEHDAEHDTGELAKAAAVYATPYPRGKVMDLWPWHHSWWKPCRENRIRELEKAGALIAAEIDRLLAAPTALRESQAEGKGDGS